MFVRSTPFLRGALRRGTAAVEFAMWLPILIVLVSAVVDWGWYMNRRSLAARGVIDGVRVGAALYEAPGVVPGSLVAPRARSRSVDLLARMGVICHGPGAPCTVTCTYCAPGDAGLCQSPPFAALVCEVDYKYTPFFGFAATPSNIYEKYLMAVENQP